mmetsp:Transcript_49605/g.112356  ORF Transcript_49605/g.112356 Transcript_49605/m.112356 type:complete len:481 (-) Transcript_49605:23-1465(-)
MKPGYFMAILRTRSLTSGGTWPQSSSSSSAWRLARDWLRWREPAPPPALGVVGRRDDSGFGFGLGCGFGRVLNDFRKASKSSLLLPSVTKFRSSHAFLNWGSGRPSQRRTCRNRERKLRDKESPVSSGMAMPRTSHSILRSATSMVSQLKSCFSSSKRSSLSLQASDETPRLEHSLLSSLTVKPSQRFTSMRLSSTCSLELPPKMPRLSASARRSSKVQRFQRSSSGNDSSAARCASADLASAMVSTLRPLRYSVSCRMRPCSVRSAMRRQEPRFDSRTMCFFRSQTVELPGTVTTRSICVCACRRVTCTGCDSSSSSSSSTWGPFSACSSKTWRTASNFEASSRAERPPAPHRRMSAPRSSSNLHNSASPSMAASMSGVVSWRSPISASALPFMRTRAMLNRLSSPVPAISRTRSSRGVSPRLLVPLGSALPCSSSLRVSCRAALSGSAGGVMMQMCRRPWPSASCMPRIGPSFRPSAL